MTQPPGWRNRARSATGLGRWCRVLTVLGALSSGVTKARGQDPAAAITAVRVEGTPDRAAWSAAVPANAFIQREPAEGGSPSQSSDVRVMYDTTTLYVRVHAFDTEPDRILSYLTRRDEDSPSDWLHVFVDSYHDRRTAYEFAVNPAGVKRDAYWYNDNNRDESWDAVWDVKVHRDPDGWSAEFEIPFSQLRFTPSPAATFGFAVSRELGRLKETSTWPLLARSATGYVSSFGELRGLSMSGSPSRLEAMPYTVANLATQPTAGNPLIDAVAPNLAVGFDGRYALTPALTLTGTINPDFGQVEADPAEVNLSAFETFFEERRPFFIEGSGAFSFGLDCPNCSGLFYSRRIGRAPQGGDALPDGDDVFTSAPSQTTILGAAKLTGRIGRTSIGVLHAVAREQEADVLDGPARSAQVVEPLTNYSVATVRRDFVNQSSVGAMVTSTNRRPAAGLDFLSDHANTAGVNFDWRFGGIYSLNGNLMGSRVDGSPEAIERLQNNSRRYYQRPDAEVNRFDPTLTTLAGAASRLSLGKIGGQRVRFQTNVGFRTPGFEINDLGFLQRADERNMSNWIQFRSDVPNRWVRSRNINFNQYARWTFDGEPLSSGGNINAHVVFLNNWRLGGGLNLNGQELDDRRSRGGPAVLVEGFTGHWGYFNTDDRWPITPSLEWNVGGDGHGSTFWRLNPEMTVRPSPSIKASLGLRVQQDVTNEQWITNETDGAGRTHYVFGRLDQTTVSFTARLSYTMTPTVSLQLYAEPFVSAGDYADTKELVDGRNPSLALRYAPYTYGSNPDFNAKFFRTTNVLRWEYRPGSTLFVVWQQARVGSSDQGAFRFSRDVGDIFQSDATNVLLVKFAYWLNF